ncbi:MAG: pitrilysin family protein [Rhodothermales bacterium]
MLRTPVNSVVTWRGSFKSYPDFENDEELLQDVTVSLLDKGTRRLDRFAIAELLEDKGAQVHFSSDGLFVDVSGRALKEDVRDVMALVAEQLRNPLFDQGEFEKSRSRIAASIRRAMENTGAQAAGALARSIYGRSHPNYSPDSEEHLTLLNRLDIEEVRRYHIDHFGSNHFTLVVVGDIDEEAIEASVAENFADWPEHASLARFAEGAERRVSQHTVIPIPEKQNVDVRLGHGVPIRRGDEDYIPLYLSNYILGGNFSARLMQIIRDEMGLTYGIRSGLYGISADYTGHWQVAVTLSQENVARGSEETVRVVRRFIEEGATEEELSDKKTTIVGSFKVGLATTGGLASTLLQNAERGFDVGYLDRFPLEVDSVSLEQTNEVLSRHLHPDEMHVAMSGMVPVELAGEKESTPTR